ncbi:allophanate hydrolase [Williamsia phyllosphaerae]|uniref:Allophanate hydrolase n=1 Tax=Williamsia phyllosphaerae TaxID=885042 RepID=A0ABQ1UKS8_9NOCA|nr:allophanate hydrolase [Williamsia phyllosphaerae]GGF21489.1 allophanate hydrolase [Williamsia phyllosphaerae]
MTATAVGTGRVAAIHREIESSGRTEIFIHLRPVADVEAELAASRAADGPLAGVILAVKDNVDVAGLPTTAACPSFATVPDVDAPVVAALRAAGAVVIGKTNLDQFATGLVGTRSPFGAVRDSRRPDHISGGSSSGSAVAVALGFADIAIGTDTAGSGRVPAGLQGIVGIKPTLGVVSTDGVIPACASYDCVTVFARDLAQADAAMAVMATAAGPRPFPADTTLAASAAPVIAIPSELPALGENWRAAFARAVDDAVAAGCAVREIDLGDFLAAAVLLYEGALVAERHDAVGDFVDSGGDDLDPTVASIISAASRWSATDLLRDRRRVDELRSAAMALLDGVDALMVPTAPAHPTLAEVAADPVGVNARMGTYTNFCNLFDMCALAVPAGVVDDGDPGTAQFGVTLLSAAHRDAVLIDVAHRLSGSDGGPTWVENVSGTVELAVFGAHLRGQPLDHQLTGRGARWAGDIVTAPAYRLVELDTTPPKPGLVRDDVSGRAIRGEKWVLSAAALGGFLAELPSPMLLGSIELADGTAMVGFGAQAQALADGTELTVDHWLAR